MAAEFDRQKKHNVKSDARRVDAGGGGGIIVIGGALIAAAISAAFVAHRARRDAGRKSRNRDAVDKALSVDGSVGCQESESEKGDEGSEGALDSSIESGADKVWPEEVIDRRKQPPELDINDNGYEEYSFASSVETQESLSNYCVIIEETREIHDSCKISDTIVETKENQTEPSLVGDANSDISKTPKIYTEQNLSEMESAHVPDEGEESFVQGKGDRKRELETEDAGQELDVGHLGGVEEEEESDASRNSSAESSRLDVWPADATEQENVHVSASIVAENTGKMMEMDGSAEGDIHRNSDLVREPMLSDVTEIGMPGNDAAENLEGSAKDEVNEEVTKYHVDEESEADGSMETGNSPMGFDGKSICPTEMVELEKASEFLKDMEEPEVAHTEEKEELGGFHNSISDGVAEDDNDNVILICSEMIHLEAEAVQGGGDYEGPGSSSKSMEGELRSPNEEENEREGSMETCNSSMEFDGQVANLDKDSARMHEMKQPQTVENMQKSISCDSAVSVQEEMCMDLDAETEESKQTFNNSEMVMEVEESQTAPGIDLGADEASDFLPDRDESEFSHVDEDEEPEDTESSVDGSITNKESEETTPDSFAMMSAATNSQMVASGGGHPSTENEMKLQFEATTKTADISSVVQAEHDEEHDRKAKSKVKGTDYVLIGSAKAFILVLALALAVGLLVFFHHEQISQYKHGIPKIYERLYELFVQSYNRAMGEF